MNRAASGASVVLVLHRDPAVQRGLLEHFRTLGWTTVAASSSRASLSLLLRERPDLAVLDLDSDAEVLEHWSALKNLRPPTAAILTSNRPSLSECLEALRRGAVASPYDLAAAQEPGIRPSRGGNRSHGRPASTARPAVPPESALEISVNSRSPRMREALQAAERAASTDATVLLRGENGTGKSVLARRIHEMSSRRAGPFVVVNCPSLSEELLVSELFGHLKGSFTGAVQDRAGRVEVAEGGTLFLDEIGEISPRLQAKLLRFLQEKRFERVGESQSRRADVRVVAATSRDLEREVQEGRFREDLLFRLNVIEITLPALRERPQDILPLAHAYLDHFSRRAGRAVPTISPAAERVLEEYPWPGNLRELRNALERAAVLWHGPRIDPEALPERMLRSKVEGPRLGGLFTLKEIEQEHIRRVVSHAANLEEAAHVLGIDDSTLWRKRKQLESRRAPGPDASTPEGA